MTDVAAQEPEGGLVWQRPVPTSVLPRRIAIIFGQEDGEFRPRSIEVLDRRPEAPQSTVYPIAENVLPLLSARSFGVEGRAAIHMNDGTVSVFCTPGEKAAGALLTSSNHRMPRGMKGRLVVRGRADPGFAIDHVPSGESAEGVPISTGELLAEIPHDRWAGHENGDLVLLCPRHGGDLTISAVEIVPAPADRAPRRGTWIWSLDSWLDRPGALVAEARRLGVTDLFLQLDIRGGAGDCMQPLLRALQDAGIAAHAVEGDPAMVTAQGRPSALDRARAIRACRDAGVTLASVQYDIEPYLLDAFAADPAAAWRAWADTVRDLSAIHGEPIDVVVPFWMRESDAGTTALLDAADAVGRVIVMVYRTDPSTVTQLAVPWLEWGVDHGIDIGIALENELLPAERYRVYQRAERGVVTISRSEDEATLMLHAADVQARPGLAVYAFSHETELDPARVSFLGDASRMLETADRAAEVLQAWTTFDILAFHRLISAHE